MNDTPGKKATLKDIAKDAQVSVATVSYVLNSALSLSTFCHFSLLTCC